MGELKKNMGWFTLSNITSLLIGILSSILITRYMNKSDYSVYTLVVTLFNVETGMVLAGIGNFLVEEVSKFPSRLRNVTRLTLKLRTLTFITFFTIFLVFSYFTYGSRIVLELLLLGNLYVIMTYIQNTFATAMIPHVKSEYTSVSNLSYFVTLIIGEIILIYNNLLTALTTILLIVSARFVSMVLSIGFYRKYIDDNNIGFDSHIYSIYEIFDKVKYYVVIAIVGSLSGNLDIVLLPVFLNISLLGLYNVVTYSFRLVLPIISVVINSVFSPLVKLKHNGFNDEHRELVSVTIFFIFIFGFMSTVLMNYYGSELFNILFNNKYDVTNYIKWATISIPFYLSIPVMMYVIYSINRKDIVMKVNITILLLYILLIITLVPRFSIIGLLLSLFTVHFLYSLSLLLFIHKKVGIKIGNYDLTILIVTILITSLSFINTSIGIVKIGISLFSITITSYYLYRLLNIDKKIGGVLNSIILNSLKETSDEVEPQKI